jgi:hypothetical protein
MALADILHEVEVGTSIASSVGPLLVKVALDALAVPNNPSAIATLFTDLESTIPTAVEAIKKHNTEVVQPESAPAESSSP